MDSRELMQAYAAKRNDIWKLQNDVIFLLEMLESCYASFCEAKGLSGEQAQKWLDIFMRQHREDIKRFLATLHKIDQELIDIYGANLELSWRRKCLAGQVRELEKEREARRRSFCG